MVLSAIMLFHYHKAQIAPEKLSSYNYRGFTFFCIYSVITYADFFKKTKHKKPQIPFLSGFSQPHVHGLAMNLSPSFGIFCFRESFLLLKVKKTFF